VSRRRRCAIKTQRKYVPGSRGVVHQCRMTKSAQTLTARRQAAGPPQDLVDIGARNRTSACANAAQSASGNTSCTADTISDPLDYAAAHRTCSRKSSHRKMRVSPTKQRRSRKAVQVRAQTRPKTHPGTLRAPLTRFQIRSTALPLIERVPEKVVASKNASFAEKKEALVQGSPSCSEASVLTEGAQAARATFLQMWARESLNSSFAHHANFSATIFFQIWSSRGPPP